MKKKLVSFLLASVMLVSSAMTVCAAEADTLEDVAGLATGSEVTGASTTNVPTINVVVPTEVEIVINPYQITYKDENENESTDQIITPIYEIESLSNVALAVNVSGLTAKGVTAETGITIATAPVTEKITTKSAFLYLEVANETETAGTYAFADAYSSKSATQLVVPNTEVKDAKGNDIAAASKEAIVTLAASDGEKAVKAGYKFSGNVVANPVAVDESGVSSLAPWTDSDSIGIAFKFTFTPQVATPAATE